MITISRIRILGLFLGALLVVVPALTHAIGLGKLKVHSALDEPLNAEIAFTSLTKRERKRLKAELASRADFSAAGIDRSATLASIKFVVAKRVDGSYFLQLQTDDPYREPFLHLLVYVEWAGGRLIREYSALIDPPYLLAAKPAKIEAPVTAPVPVPVPEPVAELPKPEPIAPPVAVPEEVPVPEVKKKPEPVVKAVAEKEAAPAEEKTKEPELAPEPEFVASVDEDMLEDMFGNQIFGPVGVGEKVKMDRKTGWPVDPFDPDETSVEPLEPTDRDQLALEPSEPMPEEAPALSTALDQGWLDDEYHVKRGDTLWEIAEQVRPDSSLSVQQVVMAIYRSNRHAFFENNVNNLKAGKVLKIPAPVDISEQAHLQARAEFQAQYDVWQEYKLKRASARQAITVDDTAEVPAPIVAKAGAPEKAKAAPTKVVKAKKPEPVKKPKAKPVAKSKAAKKAKDTTAEDLLKIVRANINKVMGDKKAVPDSEPRADAAKEKSKLADRIASTEESLVSREMETKELGDRAGQVKQQITKQKRLIELENAKLAQSKDGKAPVKPSAPSATKPVAKPRAARKPVRPAAPPPAPPAQKGFVEDLIAQITSGALMLPVLIGVVALLVIGLLLVYMKRRKQASLEFEESILNSTMDSEASGDTEGDAGDTSFLSDFSQGGMGNISTDEVDPIAEAEVYMAYGRDEQAEEILRESIVKDPSRHEVREKLLEIYHQRGDTGAFETLAEELYAALGGQGGEVWARVAALGKELNPDNPMFVEGGAPAPAMGMGGMEDSTPTTADMEDLGDLDDMLETPGADQGATMVVPGEDGGADDGMLDMGSLDIGGGEEAPVATEGAGTEPEAGGDAIDFSMDFDAGDLGLEEAAAAEEPEAAAEDDGLSLDAGGIDFNMEESAVVEEAPAEEEAGIEMEGLEVDDGGGLDLEVEEEAAAEEVLDMVEADIGGLDVEEAESELVAEDGGETAVEEETSVSVDADAEEDSELWDETATKLDLAKAYIDMGDAEGARSILDEVMAEGNDEQKAQASELASQIS